MIGKLQQGRKKLETNSVNSGNSKHCSWSWLKKMQLQPSLLATVEKLATNESSVADINNKGLVDLLKYFFDPPTEGLSKMKRQQLMEVVEGCKSTGPIDLRHEG